MELLPQSKSRRKSSICSRWNAKIMGRGYAFRLTLVLADGDSDADGFFIPRNSSGIMANGITGLSALQK